LKIEIESGIIMAICIPFLGVPDIAETVLWYEALGFRCTGSNRYWDPDAALTWAQLEWEDAAFMLYYSHKEKTGEIKDAGLYFKVHSFNDIIDKLKLYARIIELTEETFTGEQQVVFEDLNGFRVTFKK
jgi:hypothetical protein